MPFAMIHLNIAMNIIDGQPTVKEPHQFLLGALAPDAVHFQASYDKSMKFKSHYCLGHETWGNVTNNKEWLEHVLSKALHYRNDVNRDFYLGYCCHIITDIRNNIKVWMPFKDSIKDKAIPGIGKRYHEESYLIDMILYLESDKRMNALLSKSYGVTTDQLESDVIEHLKEAFLNERFSNISDDLHVSDHEYVKYDDVKTFIEEESTYIGKLLFESD